MGWLFGLAAGIVALVVTGARANAAGRLREYLIWCAIPLPALLSLLFLPGRTAGRLVIVPALVLSGLVVTLVVPRFTVLSGRARAEPRWSGAAAWIALWVGVVALVTH